MGPFPQGCRRKKRSTVGRLYPKSAYSIICYSGVARISQKGEGVGGVPWRPWEVWGRSA